MKSHLFNGRNFSTERSHLPRAFSSSIGFLADRAPPLRTTQTPLNPRRRQEGCFFSRELTVEGKRETERGRERFVSVFFNHPEKEPRTCRVLRLNRGDRWKGVSANLFTVICSGGVEGYSLNGVVSVGHSVMRAMISLFVWEW